MYHNILGFDRRLTRAVLMIEHSENMKFKILFLIVAPMMFASVNAGALVLGAFPGWDRLEGMSSDIAVVLCSQTLPSRPNYNDEVVRSDWQAVLVSPLKGTNAVGSFRLLTNHPLQRGHEYLIFGNYVDDVYEAFEDFRVVPLSEGFDIKLLSGKTLDQQLQILFQDGVKEKEREIQEDEAEKDRLKAALHQ